MSRESTVVSAYVMMALMLLFFWGAACRLLWMCTRRCRQRRASPFVTDAIVQAGGARNDSDTVSDDEDSGETDALKIANLGDEKV